MAFKEKLAQFISGKTKEERVQESAAASEIRKQVRAAALRERQIQQIRVARERERAIADREVSMIKQRTKLSGGFFRGFNQYYGMNQPRRVIITRKGKKNRKKIKTYKRETIPQKRNVDIIGWR